jgi:flagellar basal body-associated protein FliL
MKNLIYLIIIILVGIVGYMYFFGKGEDRERAANVVEETKELGKSIGDFLKRQKEKYDEGEFDKLMDKVSDTINKVKSKKSTNTKEETEELKQLEKDLRQIEPEKLSEEQRDRLKKLLNDLQKEIDS